VNMFHLYSRLRGIMNNRFKGLSVLFKSLKIRYKFFISFSVVFFLSMFLCKNELNNTTQMILNMVKTSVTVSIKNHLRAVAEKNKEIVHSLYNQSMNNKITVSEAKKRASEIILSQKICESGYIYCVDSNGKVVVHPRPAVLGSNVAHYAFVSQQMKSRQGYLESMGLDYFGECLP